MWTRLRLGDGDDAYARFTRARVDATTRINPRLMDWLNYPHPRGRDGDRTNRSLPFYELSAPVWARPLPLRPAGPAHRFIRALVGATSAPYARCSPSTIYPRPRGRDAEHATYRGISTRFIRARVGTTAIASSLASIAAIHPRPRGHVEWHDKDRVSGHDSSAPAWARREVVAAGDEFSRFIRARVGAACARRRCRSASASYPRPRRRDFIFRREELVDFGLSAPARARRQRRMRGVHRKRFIRARVGATLRGVI